MFLAGCRQATGGSRLGGLVTGWLRTRIEGSEGCAVVGAVPAMQSVHSTGMNICVGVDVPQQNETPAKR